MSGVLSDAEVLAILEDIGNAGESLLANPEHELGKVAASHRALSREATALRQQRDALREAAEPVLEFLDGCGLQAEEGQMREALRAALAQCDTQEGV